MRTTVIALTALLALPALAADPKPTGKTPAKKPAATAAAKKKAPLFTMPSLGDVPKAEGATGTANKGLGMESREAATGASYQVVKVEHAKAFNNTKDGYVAQGGPVAELKLKGSPLVTEKFSSVIRVKSKGKHNAPIDVVILDPKGDTALSASGELRYGENEETDWLVDWQPTPLRGGGNYSILVRIAGEPLGTWPLKIVAER